MLLAAVRGIPLEKGIILDNLGEFANIYRGAGSLQEGGQLEANAFGLHDMLGNVWEWTQSAYVPYPGAEWEEYTYESPEDTNRVLRGGSFRRWQCQRPLRVPQRRLRRSVPPCLQRTVFVLLRSLCPDRGPEASTGLVPVYIQDGVEGLNKGMVSKQHNMHTE